MTPLPDHIFCPVWEHARGENANEPAVRWSMRRLNWRQLNQCVTTTVGQLKEFGFRPRQRAAVVASNSVELVVLLLAFWRLGISACLISTRWPSQKVMAHVEALGCAMLVADEADCVKQGKAVCERAYRLEDCISFDVVEAAHKTAQEPPQISCDQEAVCVTTSGSSGEPKTVVHGYGALYQHACLSNQRVSLTPKGRWLLSLPCYHVSGLGIVLRCMVAGACLVVAERADAEIIQKYQVSHVSMVPTQCRRLLRSVALKDVKASLQCILLGGAPIPASLQRACLARELPVYITYGLSETAAQVATSLLTTVHQGVEPLDGVSFQVNDQGEVGVSSPTLLKGYWRDGALQHALNDGWLMTGDIGVYEDGRLTIKGRKDNMFICGGENVHPEEIEKALLDSDGIERAIVCPQPDDEFDHVPVAFIKTSGSLDRQSLDEYLLARLPKFQLPKHYFAWPFDDEMMKPSRNECWRLLTEARETLNLL